MRRIGIVAFTEKGGRLGRLLLEELQKAGYETEGFLFARHNVKGMRPFADSGSITRLLFARMEGIIFIGACGIAVRAAAPCLRSKMEDPGVVVVDECGKYVISLLSGHVGGANGLTRRVAGILGGEPVITTATDRNGLFAVDEWAVKNHLRIKNPEMIKDISSRILAGEKAGFFSELPVSGTLPEELTAGEAQAGVVIARGEEQCDRFAHTLWLMPTDLVAGIGCKSGKGYTELRDFLHRVLKEFRLEPERIGKICSVSVKAKEEGLHRLAKELAVPFETYTPQQLSEAQGCFSASDFVLSQIGVDNVCERSASLGSGGGRQRVGRQACNGMTLAVYEREITIRFA